MNYGNLTIDPEKFSGNDCGLYNGKTGTAILLYLLSGVEGRNDLQEIALILLNSVGDNISQAKGLDFANGLAGIGWGVEWIAQHGFLEMDTDEILEDIDTVLYKSIIYSQCTDISMATGILGILRFFLSRYKSKNPNTHRLKNLFHEECLVLLSNDLFEKTVGSNGLIQRTADISDKDLVNLGHIVYFMSDFLYCRVNESVAERLLYESIAFIDEFIEIQLTKVSGISKEVLRFLSFCYYMVGKNYQHNNWVTRARRFINITEPRGSNNTSLTGIKLINRSFTRLLDDEKIYKSWKIKDYNDLCLTNKKGKIVLGDVSHRLPKTFSVNFWGELIILY